jgi:hypothetical protein
MACCWLAVACCSLARVAAAGRLLVAAGYKLAIVDQDREAGGQEAMELR